MVYLQLQFIYISSSKIFAILFFHSDNENLGE